MRVIQKSILMIVFLVGLPAMNGCSGRETTDAEPNPRPITVLELRETNPVISLQLTASVKSWNEQDVAFEVDGRVEWIVESSTYLEGRWEEAGEVRVQGDVLARIDPRSYTIRRDNAAAGVNVAKQQLEAAIVKLKKVLPANLKASEAEKTRAEAEYTRNKQARDKNAISEVDLIRATADRDAAQARYEQSLALIDTQKVEIESLKASVKEAEEQLNQAQYDLDRCTLYSPFSSEVSEVYIEAGGFAKTGQPVAHLVMMDPIKVDLAVSPATAQRLKLRDTVRLFIPGYEEKVYGKVYEKATVADPETRTFRISIITRNKLSVGGLSPGDPLLKYPLITQVHYLRQKHYKEPGSSYFVEEKRALRKDEDGYYVWAAPDLKFGDHIDSKRPLITLRKFRVVPGEHRSNYRGIYLFRELTDIGELPPGVLVASDVPDGFKDGDQALLANKEWHLRPGQLIPVFLGESVPVPGIYIPMNAIKPIDRATGDIFLVDDGKARKVKVRLLDNVGEKYRVEAVDPSEAGLVVAGAQMITDHVHFLQNEEPVRVVKTTELKP